MSRTKRPTRPNQPKPKDKSNVKNVHLQRISDIKSQAVCANKLDSNIETKTIRSSPRSTFKAKRASELTIVKIMTQELPSLSYDRLNEVAEIVGRTQGELFSSDRETEYNFQNEKLKLKSRLTQTKNEKLKLQSRLNHLQRMEVKLIKVTKKKVS